MFDSLWQVQSQMEIKVLTTFYPVYDFTKILLEMEGTVGCSLEQDLVSYWIYLDLSFICAWRRFWFGSSLWGEWNGNVGSNLLARLHRLKETEVIDATKRWWSCFPGLEEEHMNFTERRKHHHEIWPHTNSSHIWYEVVEVDCVSWSPSLSDKRRAFEKMPSLSETTGFESAMGWRTEDTKTRPCDPTAFPIHLLITWIKQVTFSRI